jgi:hypothetical protein
VYAFPHFPLASLAVQCVLADRFAPPWLDYIQYVTAARLPPLDAPGFLFLDALEIPAPPLISWFLTHTVSR